MTTAAKPNPIREAADVLAEAENADVLLLNGSIQRPLDEDLMDIVRAREKKPNVFLVLVTEGGDADAGYRIARCLQENYDKFTLLCSGYCKSAGTLIALGAHELVLADCGELGPLDVQMTKTDELMQVQSGLTVTTALTTLHHQAFAAYEHFFLQTIRRGRSSISTRTATHLAVQLAVGLFAPLYEHIDPMHVGESGRALQIAMKYGQLLDQQANNLKPGALVKLTTDYPSHGFVIDRVQAEQLFSAVRSPRQNEMVLFEALGVNARDPVSKSAESLLAYLSSAPPKVEQQPLPVEDPVTETHSANTPLSADSSSSRTNGSGAGSETTGGHSAQA